MESKEKKNMGMDAIDEAQELQIQTLKIWVKAISIGMTIFLMMAIALFVALMRAMNCPHPECPHHIAEKAQQNG